jgi:hypothetical protein
LHGDAGVGGAEAYIRQSRFLVSFTKPFAPDRLRCDLDLVIEDNRAELRGGSYDLFAEAGGWLYARGSSSLTRST